jgi:hypothetical protein
VAAAAECDVLLAASCGRFDGQPRRRSDQQHQSRTMESAAAEVLLRKKKMGDFCGPFCCLVLLVLGHDGFLLAAAKKNGGSIWVLGGGHSRVGSSISSSQFSTG